MLESLERIQGVPMLCNLTSDLDQTLTDGENALIMPGISVEDCINTINQPLNLSQSQKEQMKAHSLRHAQDYFDNCRHVRLLDEYLNNL
jgi:hypothetical protein